MIGSKLAHYEITSHLGTGGMGEVYQATDSRLGRRVAIKFLPNAFTHDPERSTRFEREARVLASLNHPNIAAIYGIEQSGERKFLVMELVDGETLAELIQRGPVQLDEALAIARQIAEGLESAHEKGIIHRDLKPANIKITSQGQVKVLDFGLAKAYAGGALEANPTDSPTFSMSATKEGVILGTAAYMSPEQAKGKPVDARADIWAFGVVLYELLTGTRLFRGADVSEILASVLKEEPHWDLVVPQVRRLLRKCLAKDPQDRLRDIGDALALLDEAPQPQLVTSGRRNSWLPWVLAALGMTAAFALGTLYYYRAAQEPARAVRLSLLPPDRTEIAVSSLPAVSPDGRRVAFVANSIGAAESASPQLWIRDLDARSSRPLAGTDGVRFPFWSPDSKFIGFFADGKLKRMDAEGAPAITLADVVEPLGGSWSKKDIIVFRADNTGLRQIPAAGGNVSPATRVDRGSKETSHELPWFLPDGRHFLYTAVNLNLGKSAIYVGDIDFPDAAQTRRKVVTAFSNAVYSSGYLLFVLERTLLAQRFDAENAQTIGDPVPVAEQLDYRPGNPDILFSASENGTLVYTAGSPGTEVQLTWFDRSGKPAGTLGTPASQLRPAISPAGSQVVVERRDRLRTGFFELWLYNLAQGNSSRFTFNSDSYDNLASIWSPVGSHIAFSSNRTGARGIYQKAISGTEPDQLLDHDSRSRYPTDWSRDGQYIIEEVSDPKTNSDIWVLPRSADRKSFPYLQTEVNETHGKLSPNGLWLAYASDETKQSEIYVQSFPKPGSKRKVSTDGGRAPVWSRDGKELFFFALKKYTIMSVAVSSGPGFEVGSPQPRFEARQAGTGSSFDVGNDGRFLIPVQPERSGTGAITVVLNWQAGLKE